jgi:flagellar biogenesis protein FliO
MKRAVLVLVLLLCPSIALAAPAGEGPAAAANLNTPAWMQKHHDGDPEPPAPPPTSPSRLRGVLAGLMVLTLIGFAIWSKTKKKNLAAKNPTAYVKVSDSVKVGEKAHLVVATIGDRTVVLGVTEHGVRRLMDLTVPKPVVEVVTRGTAPSKKSLPAAKAASADVEENDIKTAGARSSGAMIAAAAIKTRFQSILNRAKSTVADRGLRHPSARLSLATMSTSDDSDDSLSSFDEDGAHWTEKLDDELRAAQRESAELEAAGPPGAVSAPLLRVANDTQERVRMRLSGSSPAARTIDPLGLEEQVSGLLAARARRS